MKKLFKNMQIAKNKISKLKFNVFVFPIKYFSYSQTKKYKILKITIKSYR